MIKAAQLERGSTSESNTKDIMIALGEILGKDTNIVEDLLNEPTISLFGGYVPADSNKKEVEAMKGEITRLQQENV